MPGAAVVASHFDGAGAALAPGGGVCGAIHRAAGPALAPGCAAAAPCPTGEARLTPGFGLPARYVIHCFGPDVLAAYRDAGVPVAGD